MLRNHYQLKLVRKIHAEDDACMHVYMGVIHKKFLGGTNIES